MKQFRKTKNRRMKSVEIELSDWVKFNEKQENIPVQEKRELSKRRVSGAGRERIKEQAAGTDNNAELEKELIFLQTARKEHMFEPKPVQEPKKERTVRVRKDLAGANGNPSESGPESEKPAAPMKKRERRKSRKKEEQEERFSEEYLEESLRRDHAWETKKEYVINRRERMETLKQDMEQMKREYRVLAEYHNDMDLLESLPDDASAKIRDTATVIMRLQRDRKSFQDDKTLLDDGKYMQMSHYTEDMPDVIRRLTSDEMYVSRLKNEIDQLEGEKSEQQFESRDVEENQGRMKKVAVACMFALFALFAVFIVMQLEFEADTQIAVLLCGIAFAAATLGVFIRYFNNVNRAKTAEHRLNKIIARQNKAKIKYVNAKNGVDYVYKKYNVHSAGELLFQWEQFIMTKNARENYQRSGNELSYYEDRLQRLMEQYRIQDPGIWLTQTQYLAEAGEMKKLRGELEEKIEQSRQKIDTCHKAIQKAKDDVSLLAIRNPEYSEAIRILMDGENDAPID